jgi:hypothetical protein
MSFFAFAFLIVGLVIVAYIMLSNYKDWAIDFFETALFKRKKKKEIVEADYELEVARTSQYKSEYQNYFALAENLDREINLLSKEIELKKLTFGFQAQVEITRQKLLEMQAKVEHLKVQSKYYKILSRAQAKFINTKSVIEQAKWDKLTEYLDSIDFNSQSIHIQNAIINALSLDSTKENFVDYFDSVSKEINNEIKKEAYRKSKLENDFEEEKQKRKI